MSLKLNTGDLTIPRIIEQESTFLPALEILPALTPDLPAGTGRSGKIRRWGNGFSCEAVAASSSEAKTPQSNKFGV
jgi:hypothetical protein